MAAANERYLQASGLILDRQPAGEHHLRLALLTADQGMLAPFWRPARKSSGKTGEAPDLFDEGECSLERARQGDGLFVKEFRLERRRGELARHYAAFQTASRLAAFFARNAPHLPETAAVLQLCRTALDRLGAGAPPAVVYLKTLVRFCQEEGYPVRQEWLTSLPPDLARNIAQVLPTPLDALPEELPDLSKALEHLEAWMRRGTDFYL
ncbi:MAG: hypothetical protein ACFB20_02200 [Opitutales bacterium]